MRETVLTTCLISARFMYLIRFLRKIKMQPIKMVFQNCFHLILKIDGAFSLTDFARTEKCPKERKKAGLFLLDRSWLLERSGG